MAPAGGLAAIGLTGRCEVIQFFVPIVPKPSNKRRAAIVGGHARVVQDKGVKSHQAAIAAIAAQHCPEKPVNVPVAVRILVLLPRPKVLNRISKNGEVLGDTGRLWHGSRPDADNLAKSVLDGLTAFWRDDCLVASLQVDKLIAAYGETPGYRVEIDTLKPWGAFGGEP